MKKDILYALASSVAVSSLLIGTAFAQTTSSGQAQQSGWQGRGQRGDMMQRAPGVFGTVSAVSGTTLTVTSKMGPRPEQASTNAASAGTETTYTVNASNATVVKDGSTSSVSAIAVGDTVMVRGTVSGTTVTATEIHDGIPPRDGRGSSQQGDGFVASLQGNGQPVIGGTVSAVSGTTLSVAPAQGGITYSVDASSATVKKGNATSSVSAVAVGDEVIVQGSVNGTAVSATSVIDQGTKPSTSDAQANGETASPRAMGGFFGAIGGFFHRLFGFF